MPAAEERKDIEFFNVLEDIRADNTKVVDFYGNYAKKYNDTFHLMGYNKCADRFASLLKEHLGKGYETIKVLDIGCGSGMGGISLKKAGFKCVDGVDGAESTLPVAKETGCYQNLSVGIVTDKERLPFEEGSYDAVLIAGCISKGHIEPENGIPEVIRLLKKNGIAVYSIAPNIEFGSAMQEHVPYVQSNTIEIISMEKHFYLAVEEKPRFCNIYCIRKL